MKLIAGVILFFTTTLPAKNARTVYLDDTKTETILVSAEKSVVLSFPTRPSKVILGNKGLFGVEYVESDLAISALKYPAQSNIFVYLEGRRFGFDLKTAGVGGDEIVVVRDSADRKVKVKIKND